MDPPDDMPRWLRSPGWGLGVIAIQLVINGARLIRLIPGLDRVDDGRPEGVAVVLAIIAALFAVRLHRKWADKQGIPREPMRIRIPLEVWGIVGATLALIVLARGFELGGPLAAAVLAGVWLLIVIGLVGSIVVRATRRYSEDRATYLDRISKPFE